MCNLGVIIANMRFRWERLRKTEGWASLQHHTILRTTLIVHPPDPAYCNSLPQLNIELKQGSYFTLIPRSDGANIDERASNTDEIAPEWHPGNIYDLHRAPPSIVDLPGNISLDKPNVYDVFVSGDYEVSLFNRLRIFFADSSVRSSSIPRSDYSVTRRIEARRYRHYK